MNQAEITARNLEGKIVRVTNIFDFEFTHAWGGIPYTLPVGKPILFPYYIGHHLAKHLAMQALIRKSPTRDEKELDGRGKDRPLWSDESLQDLVNQVVRDEYEEEPTAQLSEAELLRRKVEELNKAFKELSDKVEQKPEAAMPSVQQTEPKGPEVAPEAPEVAPAPPADNDHVAPGAEQFPASDGVVYKDKAEVIEELNKRSIKFDARKGKAELEKLLVPLGTDKK